MCGVVVPLRWGGAGVGRCQVPLVPVDAAAGATGRARTPLARQDRERSWLELGSGPINSRDILVSRFLTVAVSCLNNWDNVAWSKRHQNDLALNLN